MEESVMPKNYIKELEKLINSQKTCVIASVDAEGVPNIKGMLRPRKYTGLKTYYFSTNTSSQHVRQFLQNPHASVYFHKRFLFYKGILLKGTMDILTDEDAKRMLWVKGDEKHYPGGVTDPDYCIMRFTAHSGRFYEKKKSEDFTIEDTTAQQ